MIKTNMPKASSDIKSTGLISRLPQPWRGLAQLARLDRPIKVALPLPAGIPFTGGDCGGSAFPTNGFSWRYS